MATKYLLPIFLVILSRCLYRFEVFKSVKSFPGYQKSFDQCHTVGNTDTLSPACEDFRFVSRDIAIVSTGKVWDFVQHGDDVRGTDFLLAVDMESEKTKKLVLNNYPKDVVFRSHGLTVWNNKLFVVNHAEDGVERLEIFTMVGKERLDTIELIWEKVLLPPVPKGTMNSVTVVSEKHIYITYWLAYHHPKKGQQGATGPGELLNLLYTMTNLIGWRALGLPMFLVGKTGVVKCNMDQECQKVAPGFVSANGIAASPDGKFLFVADCARQVLVVFQIKPETGLLHFVQAQPTNHIVDNIQVRSVNSTTYELWMGTVPDYITFALEWPAPGGLTVGTYNSVTDVLAGYDQFIHDGSLIPAVSSAALWRDKVILGGPKTGGGLIKCTPNA